MRHGLAADLKGACRPDSPGDIESAEKRAYAGRRDYCAFFCIRAGDFPAPVVLKEADLIRDTREGKFIYYEINTSVLEETMLWLADLKGDGGHAAGE